MNNEESIDVFPKIMAQQKRSFFFGIVSVRIFIEDRYPECEEHRSKYKNFINIRVFWKQFSWCFRTYHLYDEDFIKYEWKISKWK